MPAFQQIKDFFSRRNWVLWNNLFGNIFGGWCMSRLPFADAVWLSLTNKITDLCNDVTFIDKGGNDLIKFAEFKAFFEKWGQVISNQLYDNGYCVISYDITFRILRDDEYSVTSDKNGAEIIKPKREGLNLYVMRSATWIMKHRSDRNLADPWLKMLDNVMNSSNTISERLGALVVMSPESQTGLPTPTVLTQEQRKELEETTAKEYGSLSKQKQLMILPRTMRTQIISLAGQDQRTVEKVRLAVCGLCDVLKLPANQVALIDANSSKSLANGSELLEGDLSKYQTFERMLQVWVIMASDFGLKVDYEIYNKPTRVLGEGAKDDNQNVGRKDITKLGTDLLSVLTTNEKREALGYNGNSDTDDKTILATKLGVGGTQSLVEIAESETLTNEEKRGYLKVLFGLSEEQVNEIIPTI